MSRSETRRGGDNGVSHSTLGEVGAGWLARWALGPDGVDVGRKGKGWRGVERSDASWAALVQAGSEAATRHRHLQRHSDGFLNVHDNLSPLSRPAQRETACTAFYASCLPPFHLPSDRRALSGTLTRPVGRLAGRPVGRHGSSSISAAFALVRPRLCDRDGACVAI